MIDCHCHMLPGCDDGAKDLQQALNMATIAVESGVSDVLLTPHHNDGLYFNARDDIIGSVARFQQALNQATIPLKVHPGSECHVMPELPGQLESGIACTYANQQRAILLELPKNALPTGAEAIIEQVAYLGIQPIIAHPERNTILRKEPERIRDWYERGWKFQLTNQSVSGEFGEDIQTTCYDWLAQGWVQFIASDAHRSKGRSPDMRKGVDQLSKWFGKEAAQLLAKDNPGRLIRGESIQDLPAIHEPGKRPKGKRFIFWRKTV
jgi:protein-tyrosine phosphatase